LGQVTAFVQAAEVLVLVTTIWLLVWRNKRP
jgi:hypothetical protein